MSKRLFGLAVASAVLLLLFTTLGSAYTYYGGYYNPGYYGGDDYNSYTYHSSRNNNGYIRTADYDRTTQEFWDGNRKVRRTTYVSERSEGYDNYYRPYGYGGYDNRQSYYPSYSYRYPSSYNRNTYCYNCNQRSYGNYGYGYRY